jgi:hypothetical protein
MTDPTQAEPSAPRGTAIHRAVAMALTDDARSDAAVGSVVRRILANPVTGRVDRAAYVSVLTATCAYLGRSHPGAAWSLIGSEVRLGSAVADLVFEGMTGPGDSPGRILVDELKTGMVRSALTSPQTIDQLDRLLTGAQRRWRGRLLGVRLVAPTFRFAFLIRSHGDLGRLKGFAQ